MIPLLEKELVTNKKWISKEQFYNYIALETLIPGSIAVNMASFIGYHKYKLPGLLTATLGVILPSILVITILSYYLFKYKNNKYIIKIISILKPTVLVLVFITILNMFNQTFKIKKYNKENLKMLFFMILTFILIYYYDINPIYVILFNLLFGIMIL